MYVPRKFVLVGVFLGFLSLAAVRTGSQEPAPPGANDRDRGIQLHQQGDHKGAIQVLSRFLKAHKEDADAWYYLGLSRLHQGDSKNARKAFEQVVKLRPDFVPGHTALSNSLLLSNRVAEAEDEVRRALSFEPQNVEANYRMGVIRLRKRECKEAVESADVAIRNAPFFGAAYLLRSQSRLCAYTSGSLRPYPPGTAFKSGATPSELTREDKLANAKKTAEHFKDIADDLEKYLQIEPNTPDALTWRQQLESLRVYSELAQSTGLQRSVFIGPEVTTKPRIIAKPEPSYTEKARTAGVIGTVVLRVVFSSDGTVQHILVLSSLPYGLTERAIDAARQIKFIPATIDGRPVSMVFQLEYNFNLY